MGAFKVLPQELILCVLTAVSASADKPADLLNAICLCMCTRRLAGLFSSDDILLYVFFCFFSVSLGMIDDA